MGKDLCVRSLTVNSPAVQWVGLCSLSAEDLGSIPGQGTKIPQTTSGGQKRKTKNFIKRKLYFNERIVL